MKIAINDDPILALVAQRAALAAQAALEREARLAAARQQEEARFVRAERIAATVGRFLRRPIALPEAAPVPLLQRRDRGDQEASQQRQDAA
jgi:hypothetical protein